MKFKETSAVDRPHFERIKALSSREKEGLSRRQSERASQVIADTGVAIRQHRDLGNGHHVMHFLKPSTRERARAQLSVLRQHPDVVYAELDELMRPLAVPNDSDYAAQQWYLQSSSLNAGATNTQGAWSLTTGHASVVVAVLDTGIRPHADPSDPGDWISAAESLATVACDVVDSSWHGTYVAGLLGANRSVSRFAAPLAAGAAQSNRKAARTVDEFVGDPQRCKCFCI